MFKREDRNWVEYRTLPDVLEFDLHRADTPRHAPYWEVMEDVREEVLLALQYAQARGYKYLLIRHGWSTSRPGQTTARSVVRGVMKSPDSTPFVVKSQSIQSGSVFVSAIKPGTATPPEGFKEIVTGRGTDHEVREVIPTPSEPEQPQDIGDRPELNLPDFVPPGPLANSSGKELLISEIGERAQFRAGKAEEYPDDERNVDSVRALARLQKDVTALPETHPLFVVLDAVLADPDAYPTFKEISEDLLSDFGFGLEESETKVLEDLERALRRSFDLQGMASSVES